MASTLVPPPRDFRQAAAYRQGNRVEQIAATIKSGITQPGSPMPAYPHIGATERRRIALFIHSLQQ